MGNPEQMYSALIGKLSKLPGEAKVYCGHEYTVKNLEFAASAGIRQYWLAWKVACKLLCWSCC